jgi:hypothetical protein
MFYACLTADLAISSMRSVMPLLPLPLQVMAKLKADAVGAKGAIVAALLAASNAHIAARRTANGLDVQHARVASSLAVRVAALVTVALTAPLYALAQRLIFSKVGGAERAWRVVAETACRASTAKHVDIMVLVCAG